MGNTQHFIMRLIVIAGLGLVMSLITTPVVAQPTAVDDTTAGIAGSIVAVPVLEDDIPADAPLDPYSITILYEPLHGQLLFDAYTGEVYYEPDPGYTGPDDFAYVVADTAGLWSNVAQSSLLIGGNMPPELIAFDCEELSAGTWRFYGIVVDESPTTCSFDVTTTAFNESAAESGITVDSSGNFSFDVALSGPPASSVSIQAKDECNQSSNVREIGGSDP